MDPSHVMLSDKVALVTGGAEGLGRGIAEGLANFGADVAIADNQFEMAQRSADEIATATGRKIVALNTDVRDEDQIEAMVSRTIGDLGGLDILVNNAGGTFIAPLMQISRKGWDMMLNLNLTSMFLASKEAFRHWSANNIKGRIVNVSSTEGLKACPGFAPYSAAKAGMINLTKTMAQEFGPYGIRVNCIAPDYTPTEGTVRMRGRPNSPELVKTLNEKIPMGRQGTPEDMAGAVIFFASELSQWVTGQTLIVDGGAWWAARVEGAFAVVPQEESSR
jgi:3-oxoacyl-[acyl-carrier protein] reductase